MPEERPPLRLPQEAIDRMKEMGPRIEEAREKIRAVEKLGIDAKQLHDQLDWAEEVRNTLLSQFGEGETRE